ncbi:MAG: HAD-IA family hydrolase [Burkholderiales bacterium]|jgi:HAD superfamily hydrolase (TIGR01509 family)|nr:HAD-IA family hydrolase [Burkholderiales bacterium]
MVIKAIIFDVDGTLADTEEAHRAAFNETFAEYRLDWRWDVALYGELLDVTGGRERIRHYVDSYRPDFVKPTDYDGFVKRLHQDKTRRYIAMLTDGGIPLRPGIRKLIEDASAAGIKLAIATTTSPENVVALLEANLGKDWRARFAAVGCGDAVPHKKPAPDIYRRVLDELAHFGIAAADCIALEDSNNGLRAALAAGLRIYITVNPYTLGQDFSGAAAVFDDLSDLDAFYRQAGFPMTS